MAKTLLFLLLAFATVSSQEKWSTTKALVSFEASVPFFEPVQAQSSSSYCILNTKKSTIIFEVSVKDFQFERSLMQEHFNEYYLETKKFPKAIFKGAIAKFEISKITNVPNNMQLEGTITIHGKSRQINVPALIKKTQNQIEIATNFSLNTDDFAIQIPLLVRDKINKNVKVNLMAVLE